MANTQVNIEVSQLYVALFGRAPDAEGLAFWAGLRDSGQPLAQIGDSMFGTTPARAYFPDGQTSQEIIASFYFNVLGRTADAGGLAFWTAKLDAPGATPGSVIAEIVGVVADYVSADPAGLASAALFNNRAAAAQFYGEHNGSIAHAADVLGGVTQDPATILISRTLMIASGAHGAFDAGGYTQVSMGLLSDDTTVANIGAGTEILVRESTSNMNWGVHPIITVELADATANDDSLTITLQVEERVDAGKFILEGIENLVVNSIDTDSVPQENLVYVMSRLHSIVVTGNGDTRFPVWDTNVDIFDVSNLHGDTWISVRPGFDADGTLVGGDGNDVFVARRGEYAISGGAGDDTLVSVAGVSTGGAGSDWFAPTFDTDPATFVTVADFTSVGGSQGADVLEISHLAGPEIGDWTWTPARLALGSGATFGAHLDACATATGIFMSQRAVMRWFQFEGDTYLVMDNSDAGTFVAGPDQWVKLVGLIDLSALTFDGGRFQ